MRWTFWVLAAAIVGLADQAVGLQPGCATCNGCAKASGLDGGPCASPPGYTLVPGCCPDHRHCCDNAWAGYCEHRAKVEAAWALFGTGAYLHTRPCRFAPACTLSYPCSVSTPTLKPTPAVSSDAAPAPMPPPPLAPKKSGRSAGTSRLR